MRQGELLEIPIDIHQNSLLPLSEIVEKMTAIDLELTDKSLINMSYIGEVIIANDNLFVSDIGNLFVFNKEGKFIRAIGSRGQGPGEYDHIQNVAIDAQNSRLFVISSPGRKIISYDLNGNFLKEIVVTWGEPEDINYINKELWLLVDRYGSDSTGVYSNSALYRLNDDMRVVDSCTIRNLYLGGNNGYIYGHGASDFILKGSQLDYLYYGNFIMGYSSERVEILCDTLYRFSNKKLIPELRLKFKNDEVGKSIDLYNIYRSSRYVFATYWNRDEHKRGYFCYDTKTGKGHNMQDGYTDDILQMETPVRIRPCNLDTEMFYYLHTSMKPEDEEEPNPTLFIGKLKK
jgi:hypothetical protein